MQKYFKLTCGIAHRGYPPEEADAGISFVAYGGTAEVRKCQVWAVKSIWKRDFQPHEQQSVFETIYEVTLCCLQDSMPVWLLRVCAGLLQTALYGTSVQNSSVLCNAVILFPSLVMRVRVRRLKLSTAAAASDSCHANGQPSCGVRQFAGDFTLHFSVSSVRPHLRLSLFKHEIYLSNNASQKTLCAAKHKLHPSCCDSP